MNSRAKFYVAGTIMLIAAIGLRSVTLGDSLWLDELHTSWVVAGPLSDVASRAAEGNQGPVYFWLVWFIVRLMGDHEWVIRLPSLIASVAALGTIALIARRYLDVDRSVALLVISLGAIDPHLVFYAREARPYALVQWLAALHLGLTLKLVLRGPTLQRRIVWIGLGWLLFYSHFTSLMLLGVEIVLMLCANLLASAAASEREPLDERRWNAWPLDIGLLVLGCLVAFASLDQLYSRRDNWSYFIKPQSISAVWSLFPCDVYVAQPLIIACLAVGVSWFAGQRWAHDLDASRNNKRLGFVVGALGFLIPVLAAWSFTRFGLAPLFHRRYTWIAVNSLLLIPASISLYLPASSRQRQVYCVLVWGLAAQYFAQWPTQTWTQHGQEDWRALAVYLSKHADDERVFLRAGLIEDDALHQTGMSSRFEAYCRFPVAGCYSFPATVVPVPSQRTLNNQDLPRQFFHGESAWLISRGPAEKAERCLQRIRHVLKRRASPLTLAIEARTDFKGLVLYRLRIVELGTERRDQDSHDRQGDGTVEQSDVGRPVT